MRNVNAYRVDVFQYRHIEEERVAEAFDRLDSDDSGFISRQNLRDFLGKEGTTEAINRIMKEGDKDNDGKSKYRP